MATTLLAGILAMPAAAQQPTGAGPAGAQQRSGDFAAFRATIEIVRVPVVVVDVAGEFVAGLSAPDFTIRDGGASQPIEYFISDQEPTTIGVLVDASAAMAAHAERARHTAMALSQDLRADDELFLIGFGAAATMLSSPAVTRAEYVDAARAWQPSNEPQRALYDAVYLGLAAMDEAVHEKRALILLTAGDDSGSRTSAATVQYLARTGGVTIHAISLREPAARAREESAFGRPFGPRSLVRATAGLFARRPGLEARHGGLDAWLERARSDICRYLNHQYLLHYTPRKPPRPGVWREIRVSVHAPFDEVRARSGYIR